MTEKELDKAMQSYENKGFIGFELTLIRDGFLNGLTKEQVDVFADHNYNFLQMFQIKGGLQDNLDISKYADPKISAEEMSRIRKKLLKTKNE